MALAKLVFFGTYSFETKVLFAFNTTFYFQIQDVSLLIFLQIIYPLRIAQKTAYGLYPNINQYMASVRSVAPVSVFLQFTILVMTDLCESISVYDQL